MTQFYSYLWLREDGSPYYAGKGYGRRAFDKHLHGLCPPPKDRILIFPMLNEEEAFESEIALIELFGRKDLDPDGLLRNLTNGGEGSSGLTVSEETIAKMSAAHKGKKHSPESRAKMSAVQMGHEVSPEARAKTSAAQIGKKLSPEHIAKISAGMISNKNMLGRKHSPETRAKLSAANKGNKQSFLGVHTRWHVNRGIANPSCKLCAQSATDFEI